ncbi:hypothetical protein A2239_04700 [Candidatus Uhrbacteria bacterium RIFOXYA2_FULL_40_9]|nr:MAG: hypothetical protein UT94_C0040G0003 [Candidatus Uhrbacteria bacterium GW2011_GWF2_40_263]OGL93973.1 MAG: hypothetical protein A2239_04700 [Candidatus Uhrbacteria bacterium RIFOXYA2_FULL_40_9]OGL97607.1 MAG: hypothetical protein A2332_03170 [Candidatus Uhrbacteria bacterium RIFOXYB2_FULL_41_18]HBK34933.1 hypothetical protein [Candidatus Uhrbacteria bacterium]HCB55348.1 hypothetical protein [Candidatus Uhrbacteria bacterium]
MTESAKPHWYGKILSSANSLAEEFGLDDFSTKRLRDYAVSIAKEQYQVGNKCGAAWAFQQARQRSGT